MEVDFVRVQKRKGGSYLVTIPAEVVRELQVKHKEKAKVYLDRRQKRIVFELSD